MSDQSDSQNAFNEVFVTESDPSSPSLDRYCTPDSSHVGRTRLLADIPPTTKKERKLRSKFLNDPSTPEEHNLTLRYLTASQNGDEEKLKELRHQILARHSRRHPPGNAIRGLDVTPLKEHAWLGSLTDAGVRVSSDFYDRLRESVNPNPPIVDVTPLNHLRQFDSDAIATIMARDDNVEVVYQRWTGDVGRSKAPMVEESSRSEREEEIVVGRGTYALWLPADATTGPLTVEIDGSWRQDALDLAYPRVARNLYHMPSAYRLIVPSV